MRRLILLYLFYGLFELVSYIVAGKHKRHRIFLIQNDAHKILHINKFNSHPNLFTFYYIFVLQKICKPIRLFICVFFSFLYILHFHLSNLLLFPIRWAYFLYFCIDFYTDTRNFRRWTFSLIRTRPSEPEGQLDLM